MIHITKIHKLNEQNQQQSMRSSPSLRLSPPTCTWLWRQHVLALVPAHLHLAAAAARWSGPCPCRSSPCPRRSGPCPCRSGRQRLAPARRLAGPRPRRGGTDRRELRVGGEKTSLGGDVEAEKKEIELRERSGSVKINKRLSTRERSFVPVGHSNRD